MDAVVKTIIDQDLTGTQETQLLRGVANVKSYEQLQGVSDIITFLGPTGRIALFFPVAPGSSTPGHWLAVWFNRKSNTLHHFDSYGFSPQEELRYSTNPAVREQLLNRLYIRAQQSGIRLEVNTFAYQKQGNNVNTCGRHVICRLRFNYMNDAMYQHMMSGQKLSPDRIVTMLTILALDEDQQDIGRILKSV